MSVVVVALEPFFYWWPIFRPPYHQGFKDQVEVDTHPPKWIFSGAYVTCK